MSFADEFETEIEAVNEKLGNISTWSEEYNTEHTDAGDGYAHMVAEGFWPDQFRRLVRYVEEHQADFISVDTLKLLSDDMERDDLVFDMEPGHILGGPSGFCIDSWIVGEIEEQVELATLAKECDLELELTKKIVAHLAASGRDHCLKYHDHGSSHPCCYLYINTDATWSAVVPDETIREAITSAVIQYCRTADRLTNSPAAS